MGCGDCEDGEAVEWAWGTGECGGVCGGGGDGGGFWFVFLFALPTVGFGRDVEESGEGEKSDG